MAVLDLDHGSQRQLSSDHDTTKTGLRSCHPPILQHAVAIPLHPLTQGRISLLADVHRQAQYTRIAGYRQAVSGKEYTICQSHAIVIEWCQSCYRTSNREQSASVAKSIHATWLRMYYFGSPTKAGEHCALTVLIQFLDSVLCSCALATIMVYSSAVSGKMVSYVKAFGAGN